MKRGKNENTEPVVHVGLHVYRFYTKNTLMVGKTLLRMGRKSEAKEWLMAALAMQGDTPDDRTAHKEASELLKSC